MAVKRSTDQLLLILIAVVFAAVAVIYIKSQGFTDLAGGFKIVETGNSIKSSDTASGLMKELDVTEDDGGTVEIEALKKDAASL